MESVAVELTPFGKFVKWVAFPVLLAVVGLKCVGPRVGASGVVGKFRSGFRSEAPAANEAANAPGIKPKPGGHAAEFERVREGAAAPAPNAKPTTDGPEAAVEPVRPGATPPRRSNPHPRVQRAPIDQTGN